MAIRIAPEERIFAAPVPLFRKYKSQVTNNSFPAVFFFGTLLDPDVFSLVVEVDNTNTSFHKASLSGFQAYAANDASYPVIVAESDAKMEGLVFQPQNLRQLARILHFEDDEYLPVMHQLLTTDGETLPALVFIGLEVMRPSTKLWKLADWQVHEKARFMQQLPQWIDDFEDSMIPELITRLLPDHCALVSDDHDPSL